MVGGGAVKSYAYKWGQNKTDVYATVFFNQWGVGVVMGERG